MALKYPPPPCPIKNKSYKTIKSNLNINYYSFNFSPLFILFLLSFSFVFLTSVTAQVKIKEKVEIKPTGTILKKGNANSIAGLSQHILRFQVDWSSTVNISFQYQLAVYGMGCTDTIKSSWLNGTYNGSVSLEVPFVSVRYNASITLKNFNNVYQIVNYDYKIFLDNSLIHSETTISNSGILYIHTIITTGFSSFDQSILANDFLFHIVEDSLSFQDYGSISGSPDNDCLINTSYRTDKEKLELKIIKGKEYVSFFDNYNYISMGDSLLLSAWDIMGNTGNIVLNYDQPLLEGRQYAVVQAEIAGITKTDSILLTPVKKQIAVNFEPEELSPGDTAKITIKHRKTDGTLESFPSDQNYKVQLIEGSNFGTILSSNGVDTSDYFESVSGGIKFIAYNNIDTSNVEVRLKVSTFIYEDNAVAVSIDAGEYPTQIVENNKIKSNTDKNKVLADNGLIMEHPANRRKKNNGKGNKKNVVAIIGGGGGGVEIYGIGKAVINNIELKILQPDTVTVDTSISPIPVMPNLFVKAQLKNYNSGAFTFNWKYTISWTNSNEPRTIRKEFEGTENGTNSSVSSWSIPWNNSFIGGDVDTLTVSVNLGNKTYKKIVINPFRILGKNPSIAAVKKGLTLQEQVIVYKESKPKWKQFNTSGFPIFGGPHGYGLMQIDTPPATAKQIWNWRENIAAGIKLLSEKYSIAINYLKTLRKKYHNVTDFTDEQLWKEIFQLYNGGYNWSWRPDDINNPNLKWHWKQIKRENQYGEDAWDLYQDVKNGNPPAGWN